MLAIARTAAEAITRVYAGEFVVDEKPGEGPVTRADREANALICAEIARAFPGMPIVAEESDPTTYAGFEAAPATWFVDPLDGTREFVARNGEFAVMIGLAEHGVATLGAIVFPVGGRAFVGAEGLGAFEIDAGGGRRAIRVSDVATLDAARVLVSRSHRSVDGERAVSRLGARAIVPCGSAGVKAARVACGEAEVYVQPGRAGKTWDICAPEAVARAAGAVVTDAAGGAFDYRTPDLALARGVLVAGRALHAAALRALGTAG